ncbi:procathepsin L-like [Mercenaria mercenaria]|uniref:procathepsin L-like n=1 Tax=Mercenaria mercenaria TaxID=6596 RepID=UPI00234F8E20|nr:procathepsin L-like [Mercenaria mercenaria]
MKDTNYLLPVFVLLHTVSSLPNLQTEWEQWKEKFGKIYDTVDDENVHLEIWKTNYKYVLDHNTKTDNGFSLEMNYLADQNLKRPLIELTQYGGNTVKDKTSLTFAPQSWDWRTKGAIGPVQNQGMLGDAQSIVAAGCVESYGRIKTGKLLDVSKMEIHDCCVKQRLLTNDIFECIHNIGGVCSAADYPQTAGTCRNNTCAAAVQINGGMMVQSGSETALMNAVYKMPVMALIDAGHPSFQLYRSGIYNEPACSSKRLDHVVQVVGYGSMDGQDYWICKNSWGVSWGDKGYFLLARNKDNMCGIATQASYPV